MLLGELGKRASHMHPKALFLQKVVKKKTEMGLGFSHQRQSEKIRVCFKRNKRVHTFFEKDIFHYIISTHLLHVNKYTRQETNYKFTPCF
jgi:hypothetical protein